MRLLPHDPFFPCLPDQKKEDRARLCSMVFSFHNQILFKGGPQIETEKQTADACPAGKKPKARFSPAKAAYYVFLSFMMFLMATQPVYASDVWTKATEIMKDVYNQIVLISTVAAIVTASVALLMMNFSRSGRTVDESRAWLKRICITWAILNGLGFIMAYITPFFADGKWNG